MAPVDRIPPKVRRRRRVAVWVVLALALLGLFVVVGSAPPMLGAREDLERGEAAVREAQGRVADGQLDAASAAFDEALTAFSSAAYRMDRLPVQMAGWLPFVGNNVDVIRDLADAGMLSAAAGRTLSDAVARLPGGIAALAPRGGAFPTDVFVDLAAPFDEAAALAERARTTVSASPEGFLIGPVGEARWEALDELEGAARGLRASSTIVDALPRFLGTEGTQRYLVVPENPAELRGTGGFWGAYSVLTLRDGRPSFSAVRAIQDLPAVDAARVPPPSADYEENYGQFGGAGSWHNLNMTPDLPTAARASLGAWDVATGRTYDGLLVADPFALERLMRVTGPVGDRATGIQLGAEDVVEFTTNGAYSVFEEARERKEVLGDVAIEVLRRFLAGSGSGLDKARALADVIAQGHLRIYSADPAFQQGLEIARLDGALPPPPGHDIVFVGVNNGGANKIDFYATRAVDHRVTLGGRGEAIARTTVTLGNRAPTSGQPRYVIGPAPPVEDVQDAGDQRSITQLWCKEPCSIVEALADGEPAETDVGTEAGLRWFRDVATVPSEGRHTVEVVTKTTGVWEGNASGGVYRLAVKDQTTIRPTPWTITVVAPDGTDVVWTSEEMAVDGGVATWGGTIEHGLELEVRFSAPAPLRWWRNVLRPFGGL